MVHVLISGLNHTRTPSGRMFITPLSCIILEPHLLSVDVERWNMDTTEVLSNIFVDLCVLLMKSITRTSDFAHLYLHVFVHFYTVFFSPG